MLINEMRTFIAGQINCSPKNVFIVQNATDGFNCVAKSLKWSAGDVILLPNIAYASIRKTCNVISDRYGVTIADVKKNIYRWSSRLKILRLLRAFSCAWRNL